MASGKINPAVDALSTDSNTIVGLTSARLDPQSLGGFGPFSHFAKDLAFIASFPRLRVKCRRSPRGRVGTGPRKRGSGDDSPDSTEDLTGSIEPNETLNECYGSHDCSSRLGARFIAHSRSCVH